MQAMFALICPQHSREEQMDMLTDKYKKVESDLAASCNPQAGEIMAFVSVEEPVTEDLSDGQLLLLSACIVPPGVSRATVLAIVCALA